MYSTEQYSMITSLNFDPVRVLPHLMSLTKESLLLLLLVLFRLCGRKWLQRSEQAGLKGRARVEKLVYNRIPKSKYAYVISETSDEAKVVISRFFISRVYKGQQWRSTPEMPPVCFCPEHSVAMFSRWVEVA